MENKEIIEKIIKLKKEKNAVILSHNYQMGEIQDIADYVGDSLGLSQTAAKTDADVIVFCGVHFMAETAAILCPEKMVLLPDLNAGCPMANMITARQLREKKKEYPDATVVCYVNSSAEVKAESDYCCTSANALALIESLTDVNKILFIPDRYLGHYVARKAKKEIILWPGYCPTHHRILVEDIEKQKAKHPNALVLVHPECTPGVIDLADKVLSTSGICKFAKESEATEFIIGTEVGMLHRLKKENPQKKFYSVTGLALCPNMKLINLEKVLWSLEDMAYQIKVPENIAVKAKRAIDRMLEVKGIA
ncbi:MAG: quinolinate synthase NadA [Actinobacteria bacterium]|nr:quinolinate synthase NadA [Actinomycetota bacterium]